MAKRATMKDVAGEAGVGVMTVSRVVNGEPGVAPETVARVEAAIRKLGYRRDDVARQLRRGDELSQTIGLMVDHVGDPFMAAVASAVEDVARLHDCVVLIGNTRDDLRREREVFEAFTARRVDGMILTPVAGSHSFLHPMLKQGAKVVCVDRAAAGLNVDTVVVDNLESVRHAMGHLIAHGHRRIAYLGDRLEIGAVGDRFRGYKAALQEAGIEIDPSIIRHGLRNSPDSTAAVAGILASADPPTAIFTSNDIVAFGVLPAVPAGTAFLTFDDFTLAAQMTPPVTVIAQDPAAIGTTAAHLLFARIHGDVSPPRTVVMPTSLIQRGSGEIPGPHAQGL